MTDRIRNFLRDRRPEGPCLVVDLDIVRENYETFARAMPDSRVFYAVKANPAPEILSLLAKLGSSFDCASVAEFHQRLQEDKVIYGQSLFTRRGEEKGEYEIVDRNEMILGREAIWSVTVPRDRYFEYSEVA